MRRRNCPRHLSLFTPCVIFVTSLFVAVTQTTQAASANEVIKPLPFLEATPGERGQYLWASKTDRVDLLGDRYAYHADELNGQFLAVFLGQYDPEVEQQVMLRLKSVDTGRQVAKRAVGPVTAPKLPFLIHTQALTPGEYEVSASLSTTGKQTQHIGVWRFKRTDKKNPSLPIPEDGIAINVHALDQPLTTQWPLSIGVPMPKAILRDTSELLLLEDGHPVAAQFEVRGTWTPQGYIKWVGVDFVAEYVNGKPRSYRLVRRKHAPVQSTHTLKINETDDQIEIDTGVIRFHVSKQRFAGLERVWRDADGDRAYSPSELIVDGIGGSFTTDNKGRRLESALNNDVKVVLENAGNTRVTIACKGWYADITNEKQCKFVIRITAYAGRPDVFISHRTINTIPDRYVDIKLTNAGFGIKPAGKVERWMLSTDGKVMEGSASTSAENLFLHQQKSNHLRVMRNGKFVEDGRRSDGWMSLRTDKGLVTVMLRDVWQKFPNEFEAELNPAPGRSSLNVHFWPKHGQVVFPDETQTARDQIYKVQWAHHGKELNMKIPDAYHKALEKFNQEERWASGAELYIVDKKNNLSKMQAASGQGTVIGNEMVIRFDDRNTAPAALTAQAKLLQQSPHGLADAKWNCATMVLGPIAARDPDKFGPAEKLLDTAYNFYQRGIIDANDEYGMWIYGGVHNNWQADRHRANLKRVWQMSHYQNVFQAWLLYFRSGMYDHFKWAYIHANQHMDVGVCNYLKYPKGKHSYGHLPDMGGNIYHCKGFMPWAGNSSTAGHWIDITNYFSRYHLTGDRRGLDMADRWFRTVHMTGGTRKPDLPTECEDYRSPQKLGLISDYRKEYPDIKDEALPKWMRDELAKPKRFNPREVLVPLGEMTQYYQSTWDPQAILSVTSYAEYLNPPFECTGAPTLSHFGKHWQDWYYELSRDPRVVDRIARYMESVKQYNAAPRYYSFAAFLYHTTGDAQYLKPTVSQVVDSTSNIYSYPGDRYDGFNLAHSNPAAMLLGRLPFYLSAVDHAGLNFEHSGKHTAMITRGGRVDAVDKWLATPRGWSNAGMTVLATTPNPMPIEVRINGPQGFGSFRGIYMLFYGFPQLNYFQRPDADRRSYYQQQKEQIVPFPAKNRFNDPPTQRNFGARKGARRPYIERPDNDPNQRQYRLEYSGDPIDLPVLFSASTGDPLPQVAVIARHVYWNATQKPTRARNAGVSRLYFRPLDSTAVINIRIVSHQHRYSMPTTVRITDAKGDTVVEGGVFMAGNQKELTAKLDPAKHPLPWQLFMASSGDNQIWFDGADELFFAVNPEDFETILPQISVYQK